MSKRNYLNVVSAGVVAFGTLALGLVTVLPVANAANAAEASNEFTTSEDYYKNLKANPNAKTQEEEVAHKLKLDQKEETPRDPNNNRYVNENYGHPAKKAVEDNHSNLFTQYNPETGTISQAHNTGNGSSTGLKDDAPVADANASTTKPETPAKKNAETPVATPESKAQKPSADKGAAKDAGKGQQQVKKGHHKFGAPNTGYEF